MFVSVMFQCTVTLENEIGIREDELARCFTRSYSLTRTPQLIWKRVAE